jgi:MoaA/NifB/PqqE/SkfB family radical SAM enzyme
MVFRSLSSKTPPYLIFFVTSRCDARCVTCFNWRNLNTKDADEELSLGEIEKIADSCRRSVFLSLSGGEPFLRRDIAGICAAFHKRAGTMMINIPTNGLRPGSIRDHTAAILEDCPRITLQVELSIDGIGDTHDTIRGVPGNFGRVMETFGKLRSLQETQPRLRLKVCSVLNEWNRHQMPELMAFVAENMPVDDHSVVPVHGDPRDEAVRGGSLNDFREIAALADSMRHGNRAGLRALVFREVQAMARESILRTLEGDGGAFRCPGGTKLAVIGETGLVHRCETMMDAPLGNLREEGYDLGRILRRNRGKTSCSCGWSCAHLASVLFTHRGRARLALRVLGKKAKQDGASSGKP